ncbi:unnamed protein product, partial [Rotaria sp. Silwood1]
MKVYSMSSSYARALHEPLLNNKASCVWEYALQLVYKGFNYNYYDFKADKSFQYDEQNIVHYLDHATALIKHIDDSIGNQTYAPLYGKLLCRLGSYYLNERRMYSEAAESYSEAEIIFNNINNFQNSDNGKEKLPSSLISKCSAKLMWHICDHLSCDFNIDTDKEFVSKIKETRSELEKISENSSQPEKDDSKRYEIEATVAIARIQVQIARNPDTSENERNELLEYAQKELEEVQKGEHIGTRTRSLLLQILGSTYSLLKNYDKAIASYGEALISREKILSSEHLDVARTKYRLALCLAEYISNMSHEDRNTRAVEVKEKLNEAQLL